jgi:hypothetical protein
MGKNTLKNVLGFILLTPALISVVLFLLQLVGILTVEAFKYDMWTGDTAGSGGGYTSALPIYFGLMAIAGVYMLTDHKK